MTSAENDRIVFHDIEVVNIFFNGFLSDYFNDYLVEDLKFQSK